MVNLNSLLPAVSNLIYSEYFEESTEIDKLKALLKFDRVVLEVLSDALQAKTMHGCNSFLICNLFEWYSKYVKCYELLIQSSKIVEISPEEKKDILEMIKQLDDIDDADEIINKLVSLPVFKERQADAEVKSMKVIKSKAARNTKPAVKKKAVPDVKKQ